MTAATDASTRGRRNRANGNTAERAVAVYLRGFFPDARRAVVNGWRTADLTVVDPGDIDGTSPSTLWWSVKSCQQERLNVWMAEMDAKAAGRVGLLVVRRRGYRPPGWRVWLTLRDWTVLLGAAPPAAFGANDGAPVCVELADLVPLLRAYTAGGAG